MNLDWLLATTRERPTLLRLLVVLVLAIVGALVLWALIGDKPQSVAAYARTRGLEVHFAGEVVQSPWYFAQAKICRRLPPAIFPDGDAQAICDPRLYDISDGEHLEILWPAGTRLKISRLGYNAPLEIDILALPVEGLDVAKAIVSANSRLIIDDQVWQAGSTLAFEGEVRLGDHPGSGSNFDVIEGSFAITERMFGYDKPIEVLNAPLRSGDVLRVTNDERPARVIGFVAPAGHDEAGVMATLFSSLGESVLEIDRYGAVTLEIRPNPLDRATKHPLILALAALWALVSVGTGIVQVCRWVLGTSFWVGTRSLQTVEKLPTPHPVTGTPAEE
jgi:hypothetical protein